MKSERLFRAIADVGDDLIERAARPVKRSTAWVRWGALAACLVLVIGVAAYLPALFGAKSAAPTNMMQDSAQITEEMPMAEEAPAEEAVTEAPEPDMPADAPAEMAPEEPAPEADTKNQDMRLLDGTFTQAELICDGDMVVSVEGEPLQELLSQLRALPQSGGTVPFDLDQTPLVIRLFDGQTCTAQIELPWFCALDAANGLTSQEAIDLYVRLIEDYFG